MDVKHTPHLQQLHLKISLDIAKCPQERKDCPWLRITESDKIKGICQFKKKYKRTQVFIIHQLIDSYIQSFTGQDKLLDTAFQKWVEHSLLRAESLLKDKEAIV